MPIGVRATGAEATAPQVAFYVRLSGEIGIGAEEARAEIAGLSRGDLSERIDARKDMRDLVLSALPELEEGYYDLDGDVHDVRTSRGGNRYAMLWAVPEGGGSAKWTYAPGAYAMLRRAEVSPLTLEQAVALEYAHVVKELQPAR